jgi:tRNA A58 N-methylase Trm61
MVIIRNEKDLDKAWELVRKRIALFISKKCRNKKFKVVLEAGSGSGQFTIPFSIALKL